MFTGIIEATGRVVKLERSGERASLELEADEALTEQVSVGDSIAISGCCLTVTARSPGRLRFDAVAETLRLTSIGDRVPGDRVNLERALRADGLLGGHIVQGHVDGTGRIEAIERSSGEVRVRVGCSSEVARWLVPKGSVTVDGVSLTVVDPDAAGFWLALIPHTLQETTLGEARIGTRVNLEADVLGKYVLHYLERIECARPAPEGP
ncbi:MAG: riboflavin synthase [Myxococcota bacterium]